jgi:hypothetical protein
MLLPEQSRRWATAASARLSKNPRAMARFGTTLLERSHRCQPTDDLSASVGALLNLLHYPLKVCDDATASGLGEHPEDRRDGDPQSKQHQQVGRQMTERSGPPRLTPNLNCFWSLGLRRHQLVP